MKAKIPALAELAVASSATTRCAIAARSAAALANNDPAADYPAAALALGATIKTDRRSIKADDFFQGMFTTALEQGELITAVEFPVPEKAALREVPQSGLALRHRRRVRGEDRGRRARGGDRRGPE